MRYRELDFLRGLCLLDMVIVHLIIFIPERYFESLVEMTNIAAEGFFLISGMMVGLVYFPRFLKDGKGTSVSLLKKAFLMLGFHMATIASFMLIYHLMGLLTIDSFSSFLAVLYRIASFEKVYHLTNILYLFFLYFLFAPIVMEGYRRWGWRTVAIVSSALLAVGFWNPLTFSISYPDFPIITWQWVFVVGFLLGLRYPEWKGKKITRGYFFGAITLFSALFCLRFQDYLGLAFYPHFFEFFFKKFPLQPGLVLYVGLLLLFLFRAVHTYWEKIPFTFKDFISAFGAYSLPAFIVHMHLDFFIHKADEAAMFGFLEKLSIFVLEILLIYLCVKGYEKILNVIKTRRKNAGKG